jgi:general secretion pathway protein G
MTFIELVVVAVVASVLATVAIPTGLTLRRGWQERQLKRSLVRIRAAIDAYHLDWENGCIESDDEKGWPEDLEELTVEKELADDPQCTGEEPGPRIGTQAEDDDDEEEAPPVRRYLSRLPVDPFNEEGDEHDTGGWKARSYEDEPDASTWKNQGVYDVYSASELTALDGTKYSEW